jgi:hypothetical protein
VKTDSVVECGVCQKRARVNFSACLRRGWPRCCLGQMTLVSKTSAAMVGAAMREIFAGVRLARERVRRSGDLG